MTNVVKRNWTASTGSSATFTRRFLVPIQNARLASPFDSYKQLGGLRRKLTSQGRTLRQPSSLFPHNLSNPSKRFPLYSHHPTPRHSTPDTPTASRIRQTSMRLRLPRISAAAALAVITLAACGGGDQTSAAAACLRNALAARALSGGQNINCADPTAAKIGGGMVPRVACTHQNGNQYVCDTSHLGFDPLHLSNHFYSVTYDGKSIVYQQTQ